MYAGNDVLTQFKEELEEQLPVDADPLEELPPKGDLDLSQVMQSDFFFA
jgi:DNA-directed RNA polymerase